MKDLLLEIGVEELPARFVGPALAALETLTRDRLSQAGLTPSSLRVLGTPRRLAVVAEGLPAASADRVEEALGPGLAQAKTAEGAWTPAALGFAKAQGVAPEELEVRATDRGPRLVRVRRIPGSSADRVLLAVLPEIVRGLPFPKTMVWEPTRFAFARPLRWIVALLGAKPLVFSVAGVKSGKRTQGLRFHARKPIGLSQPSRYAAALKNHCVIVDPAERRDLIVRQIQGAVRDVQGHVPLERFADLLDEVTQLVEHPVAVLGAFDPRFLALPSEVLVTSMKKHQKFFPVFKDPDGREPTAAFVGLRNGFSDSQAVVREGYERVLAARLSDALFFVEQDGRRRLSDRVPDLSGIAFLSPTLSLADKKNRTIALADRFASAVGLADEVRDEARRILALGKADLTTGMVGEFPELQGIMGRIYALRDGESAGVARGIEEHYWPLTADGVLPSEESAAVAALADKWDTLAGNFLIGKSPSGSQDPYGLRRAAAGVLRLLETRGWTVSPADLTRWALDELPAALGDRAAAERALNDFLRQRWAALAEGRGFRVDEVDAVAGRGLSNVPGAVERLSALRDIRRHPDFGPLSTAFKRAANLLKQAEKKGEPLADEGPADGPTSLGAERALADRVDDLTVRADALWRRGAVDYLSALVSLRAPVDDFFAEVVVMDENPMVRRRRLALLARVRALFDRVADFSRLQETPGPA